MSDHAIRVLCVDDHPVVRSGLTQIIDLQPDMHVVGTTGTGEEAIELFRQYRPDVTLMDLQLPGMSGLEAIRIIRKEFPDACIVVLTMYQGDADIGRALDAGVSTYLLKDTLSQDLVRTIREVRDGGRPLSSAVAERLGERADAPHLTIRELQIIELLAEGMRNKEIASALGIAEETVHAHVKKIFVKLNVNDRTAALTVALRRGIIHLR